MPFQAASAAQNWCWDSPTRCRRNACWSLTNTGDDFDHFGLRICPDTDTVIYTLSDLADKERGWGRAGESWNFMAAMREIGGADWFNLGDRDLALHVYRTDRLRSGASLSEVTADICGKLGIKVPVLPMCDQPVATMVDTAEGRLAFQHYFVREQCAPQVTGFAFEGMEDAQPNPALASALREKPAAIIVAPSNPYVSVAPILAVPGTRRETARMRRADCCRFTHNRRRSPEGPGSEDDARTGHPGLGA